MRILVKLQSQDGREQELFSLNSPRNGEWDTNYSNWVYDPHSKALSEDVKRARAVLLAWLKQLREDDAADGVVASN